VTFPKPRILLTEDHADTRELVTLILEPDYEVTSSASVLDALNLAKTCTFNLFIFDSRLPDGSGVDLCKQIRDFDPETPILFYSALAFEADKTSAFGVGAQAYLVKPVDVPELLFTVRELIAKSVKAGSTSQKTVH
jgi:DNA-binding response OmpR family regulator